MNGWALDGELTFARRRKGFLMNIGQSLADSNSHHIGRPVERITDLSLRLALAAAALGSVIMLALMVTELFIPLRWNWYNALAFFAATTLLSGTRYLRSLVRSQPAVAKQ